MRECTPNFSPHTLPMGLRTVSSTELMHTIRLQCTIEGLRKVLRLGACTAAGLHIMLSRI